MSTFLNAKGGVATAQPGPAMARTVATPLGDTAQQGAAHAMEFQLWVSQQASSLAKLKIFNTMAKSINDQQ